jgi:hypothetical protein
MTCPSCSSTRVYPSRVRNILETLRHRLTGKQPYRCHDCNWRGWRDVEVLLPGADIQPDDLRTGRSAPPVSTADLDPLDPTRR